MKISRLLSVGFTGILMLGIYFVGYEDGMHDEGSQLISAAEAAGGGLSRQVGHPLNLTRLTRFTTLALKNWGLTKSGSSRVARACLCHGRNRQPHVS